MNKTRTRTGTWLNAAMARLAERSLYHLIPIRRRSRRSLTRGYCTSSCQSRRRWRRSSRRSRSRKPEAEQTYSIEVGVVCGGPGRRCAKELCMSDLARLKIWDDPAVRGALSWYLDVAENRRPAKFRIAATVATGLDPLVSCEDALWAELDRLTPIFLARWQAIRAGM